MATEPKKEQQPLPEEKLLKVIQGKGGAEKSGKTLSDTKTLDTAPKAAARPAAPTAPAPGGAAGAAERARLALKPGGKLAKDAAPSAVKAKGGGKPSASKPAVVPAIPSGKRAESGITISMCNRFMGAAACIFLALTAFEVVSEARALRAEKGPVLVPEDVPTSSQDQASTNAEPSLADIDISIFKFPPEGGLKGGADPKPEGGWQDYVVKNMNMIGRSGEPDAAGCEAIVFDKKENKMHVLKLGQTIAIASNDVAVQSIGADEVILTDGRQKLTLK